MRNFELQRRTRERSLAIRETARAIRTHAALHARKTATVVLALLPTMPEELDPTFHLLPDPDLETLLRRNQLTDALQTYLNTQRRRSTLMSDSDLVS